MDIAILAPSAVPFAVGGAERLCWALQAWLNENTVHRVELIRLPSPESDFWSLVASYRAFGALDVRHFDCVVSTKYPSWMVDHPRHVCYMLHRLRGLYDAYHFFRAPERVDHDAPRLRALQAFMRAHPGDRGALDEAYARLEALRTAPDVPADAFAFPGPLTREVVHFLDGIGLSRRAVARFASISRTVAQRRDYFPLGAAVEVAYPPPQVTGFRRGEQRHFFTMSRLDGPKRLDLLIDAMRYVDAPVPLKIAGTGPEGDRLRAMAAADSRIELIGAVSDADAVAWYADALAVPFVPYDEDLGLITLEAMMSGKPVVTVDDAGGPLEFVEHGLTGLVARPTPESLGAALDAIARDPAGAARMGEAACARVAPVGWGEVARVLLDEIPRTAAEKFRAGQRTRMPLVAAVSFPVYPPRGGGQTRVFHLYRHLARHFDVRLVTLADHGASAFDAEIAPGVREIRIPKSSEHATHESASSARVDWVPVTDVALPELHRATPDYARAIAVAAPGARAVVASHPFALPAILDATDGPVWYEAHNVEFALKRGMFPDNAEGRRLVALTREVEAECCTRSELLVACTREDAEALAAEYGSLPAVHVVPNGVDLDSVRYVEPDERRELKARIGLAGAPVSLFMASWHGPNLEAAEQVLRAAAVIPSHLFLIVGSACSALSAQPLPPNVKLLGVVDDETKAVLLGAVDLALNPMISGSGSNLKMLDYMAAGVPVLTSRFGARGTMVDESMVAFVEPGQLADGAVAAMGEPEALAVRARRARAHVEEHFCWRGIAERFVREIGRSG